MTLTTLKLPLSEKLTLPAVPASFLLCTWLDDDSNDSEFSFSPTLSISPADLSTVEKASILTNGCGLKPKVELLLNIEEFDCSYLPGDTVGIFPVNPQSEVELLLDLLSLKGKGLNKLSIDVLPGTSKKNASVPKHLPKVSTIQNIFSKHLEIKTPIKKLFLRSLCNHTLDDTERRRLEELSSKECAADYTTLILSKNVTLLDVLTEFKSCKPPISLLLEHLPPMKPRVYSIASSPLTDKKQIRIVVTVFEKENGSKGICSGYLSNFVPVESGLENALEQLKINTDCKPELSPHYVTLFFRQPNSFRYPQNPMTNLILIGPGSGVAPFIGFLDHKKALNNVDSSLETWLFFGCRNDNDYLYRKELSEFLSSGVLTKLFVSFSRPSCSDNSPKYVQDNILSVKDEFIQLLTKNSTLVYICGDAQNMLKAVLATINKCFQLSEGLSENDADIKVNELVKAGIIITDSWV